MTKPNILITGTPGAGKTRLAKQIAENFGLQFLEISKIVTENNFIESYDDTLECPILDEDKLLDYLEPIMQEGNKVAEYHSSEFFPERWFQAVYVVRCDNDVLFKRLEQRGYNALKIKNNCEYEIFQTALDEAMSSYKPEIVFEVRGENEEQLEENLQKVGEFLNNYNED